TRHNPSSSRLIRDCSETYGRISESCPSADRPGIQVLPPDRPRSRRPPASPTPAVGTAGVLATFSAIFRHCFQGSAVQAAAIRARQGAPKGGGPGREGEPGGG